MVSSICCASGSMTSTFDPEPTKKRARVASHAMPFTWFNGRLVTAYCARADWIHPFRKQADSKTNNFAASRLILSKRRVYQLIRRNAGHRQKASTASVPTPAGCHCQANRVVVKEVGERC